MRCQSRRRFVQGAGAAGLAVVAGCGRLPWQAPAPAKVPRIAFLSGATPAAITDNIEAFRRGLADRGHIEGQNLVIEWRFGEGAFDRMPALAAELVSLAVEIIVVPGSPVARVASEATSTIPIVVVGTTGDGGLMSYQAGSPTCTGAPPTTSIGSSKEPSQRTSRSSSRCSSTSCSTGAPPRRWA